MLAALALFAVPALAGDGVFPYPVHHERLDNGLDVYVVPMATPGVVAFYTWMSVGSRDEVDPGRTGFAHFFEHLMFYGTETLSREGREQLMLRQGAEDNAWTWFDETVYHTLLSPAALPGHVAAEGDRFQALLLTPDDVRKEAGAVYGEYRKGQADPDQRLMELLYSTAFGTHTYGHDTIGYEADIADMPTAFEYSEAFFSRMYRPRNADVIVAGDVDPDDVFGLVRDAYGGWEPGTEPRPTIPAEPAQDRSFMGTLVWPTPTAPRVAIAWKAPASAVTADVAALDVAADLLLGPGGPIERRLVKEEQVAYAVWGGRDDFVDPGLFKVTVVARDEPAIARIEAVIADEVKGLATVDPDRLAATKTRARYQMLSALDNPDVVASFVGHMVRRHGSTEAIDTFYAAYDAVTPADVARAASTWLVDTARTEVTLTPLAEEAP